MIKPTLYQTLRTGFGNYIKTVDKLAGSEAAQKTVKVLSDTLRKVDTFYDTDAVTGSALTRSLNGKSQSVTATQIFELSETFKTFEAVPPEERKSVIHNLTLSLAIQLQKKAAPETPGKDA